MFRNCRGIYTECSVDIVKSTITPEKKIKAALLSAWSVKAGTDKEKSGGKVKEKNTTIITVMRWQGWLAHLLGQGF